MTKAADSHRGCAPEHGQVVHGAVHREVADGTAGEAQRLHDEGVGGEGQPLAARQRQRGGVGERHPLAGCERLEEDGVDEGGGSLAAGPVGHRHQVVGQSWRSPPVGLDAVEHPRLAVAHVSHRSPPTGSAEALLHRLPESEAQGGLGLLDPVHAVGLHDEAVLHVGRAAHLPAVVAGQPDGDEPAGAGLGEGGEDVGRAPAGGEPERHVTRRGVGDELPGEHQLEPHVVAQRRQHRRVVDETASREGAAAGRSGEQRGERRRVGRAAAVAEGEQSPSSVERFSHGVGCRGDRVGWSRASVTARSAALVSALATAERPRSTSSEPASRSSPSMKG